MVKVDYIIKKLVPADLSIAKQLIKLWQTEDGYVNPIIPNDNYLHDLLSKDSFHFFVAMKEELVIGGLTAYELSMYKEEETEMFLYEIGVEENYRQKGIATKLIDSLKETCAEKSIKIIFVGTSTGNEPAKQLYKTTGGEMEEVPWFTYNLDNKAATKKSAGG
jgi:aminoglycoside 3-N-acetyltransferase I